MLNNIFGILEKIGFGAQKRAISIQFSNAELNSQIMLQRIDGYHGMANSNMRCDSFKSHMIINKLSKFL